jgi:hypothetical protein
MMAFVRCVLNGGIRTVMFYRFAGMIVMNSDIALFHRSGDSESMLRCSLQLYMPTLFIPSLVDRSEDIFVTVIPGVVILSAVCPLLTKELLTTTCKKHANLVKIP